MFTVPGISGGVLVVVGSGLLVFVCWCVGVLFRVCGFVFAGLVSAHHQEMHKT